MSSPDRPKPKKIRADQLVLDRGLAPSRARAQALILAGKVMSADKVVAKAGQLVPSDAPLTLRAPDHPYVSRGGLKLAAALDHFALDPAGATCLDIGASTGGFTDVLLRRGAAHVFAIDVGHGQLDWSLRNDQRVTVLERTNARALTADLVPPTIGFIVCDASFIGLRTVLPAGLALAAPGACLIALIKPQFEVGRGQVGKGGVVRDPQLHSQVCDDITDWLNALPGWQVVGIADSPITGPAGNKEFLVVARRDT